MKISLIIPTRNRAWLLEKTLGSLVMQQFPLDQFEILICDHASSDHSHEVANSFNKTLDINFIRVPYERFSVQKPKNAGLRLANNEIILIIDRGIICPPDFLQTHHDAHFIEDNIYVSGPTYGWDCETENDFWLNLNPSRCISRNSVPKELMDCRMEMVASIKYSPWMLFWGCNCSARASNFREAGGFDESLTGWGWDDLDLGVRLDKLGLKFRFLNSAWCLHYPHERKSLKQRMEEGTRNWIKTYKKLPKPELELWEASDYVDYDKSLAYISNTLRKNQDDIPELNTIKLQPFSEGKTKTLYWGIKVDSKPPSLLSSITIVDAVNSSNLVHSFGLRTPFGDKEFDCVVMSSYWQYFNFRLSPSRPIIAHLILKEALRIASKVILFDLHRVSESATEFLKSEISKFEADVKIEGQFDLRS